MLDFLADAAVNTATGGLFGLVGTGIQAVLKGYSDAQEFKHDIAMREMDIKVIETESRLRVEEIEAKTEAEVAVAEMALQEKELVTDADIRKASYTADKASYGIRIVDAIRGLMRPTITVFLVVATFWVASDLWELSSEIKPEPAEAWALYSQVVQQLLFLTATAVTWWFGSRLLRNPEKK